MDERFLAQPQAAFAARHRLDGLKATVGSATTDRLSLLVTELVTNAVIHGSSSPTDPVEMKISISQRAVRVEVTSQAPGREADRWGIEPGPPTTV